MTLPDQDQHWYIAFVRPNREKKAEELLARLGYVHYLPVQKVRRKWSDRIKTIDQLVIPRMIFVRGTNDQRLQSLRDIPMMYAYMMDHGTKKPAVVRDSDMESFRFMVEHGEEQVTIRTSPLTPGDRVQIINGPMRGLECEYVSSDGTSGLAVVSLGILGAATINIASVDLRKL